MPDGGGKEAGMSLIEYALQGDPAIVNL